MKMSVIKQIIGGALLGTFVFFTGPLLLIVFLLKFIFTPFGMGRMGMGRQFFRMGMGMQPLAFAEKVRGMNDEEYATMKTKMESRFSEKCGNYQPVSINS